MQNIKPIQVTQLYLPTENRNFVVQCNIDFLSFIDVSFYSVSMQNHTRFASCIAIFRPKYCTGLFVLLRGQFAIITSCDKTFATVKTLWNGVEESCEVSELTSVPNQIECRKIFIHETNFNQ